MKIENSVPIILFTYRRIPKKTIDSLIKNNLSRNSDLFIFSDGNKSNIDKEDVINVRQYINSISGFKTLNIIEANENKGLAISIINGVSKILDMYEKVIVLEDDLIVSKDFLDYMNDALDFYKDNEAIWSIAGYGPKLPCLDEYKKDIYLSLRGSSWGWATWKDRWNQSDWNVTDFNKLKKNKQLRKDFELGGEDMYKMLELQMLGKIDSWAIRWCFSQFILKKYTIYPKLSKIVNDGFSDDKGTHNNGGNSGKWYVEASDKKVNFEYIDVDMNILRCWKEYYKLSAFTHIGYLMKKYGGYKLIKTILKSVKGGKED